MSVLRALLTWSLLTGGGAGGPGGRPSAPAAVPEAHLLADDGAAQDFFGSDVAISGDTLVVGADGDDTPAGANAGSAYVFARSEAGWTFQQKITALDGAADDAFGVSVALSGDTLVVGASDGDGRFTDTGAAYVFVRTGSTWTQQAKLTAVDGFAGNLLGSSVSLSGDTVIAGAPLHNLPGAFAGGAAYVFVRTGTTWSQQQKLIASTPATLSTFGGAVSVAGDTLVVGAPYQQVGSVPQAGAVYAFVRTGTTWTQQQQLVAADARPRGIFGTSVSLSGDTVAIGGPIEPFTAPQGVDRGAAYVFVRTGTAWSQQQKLTVPDATNNDRFGFDLALEGERLVVGAIRADTPAGLDAGAAYVFTRAGTSWSTAPRLLAPDGAGSDRFGGSVALSASRILVGARGDDTPAGADAGSAHVFVEDVSEGDLTVTQGDAPDPVVGLETVTYTLDVSNLGPEEVSAVVLRDTLPGGTTFVSAQGAGWTCGFSAGLVTCNRPALLVEAAPAVTVVVRAGAGAGTLTNLVSVTHSGIDPAGANNSDSETTTVTAAPIDLAVTQGDAPDPVIGLQPVSYTIRVTNLGPAAAASVSLTDTLPGGTTFVSAQGAGWTCGEAAGTVTCSRAALAVGPAPAVTVVVRTGPSAGTLTSVVTVAHAGGDPAAANNSDTETTTVTAPPTADLSITKSDGGVEARWGQPFTWTITAGNAGPDAVAAAFVEDAFPAGVSGVSWTCTASAGSSCPASGTGAIAATVGLAPGGEATFIATGTVVAGTSSLVNTASSAVPEGTHDPASGNNSASVTTAAGPIGFFTLTPCRVADTRAAQFPALSANSTRTFAVGGVCGVPSDARAVAAILVAVNPGDLGNLRLYPTGQPLPLASAINFTAGHTRANNAVMPLGTGGQVDVRCDMAPGSTATTHFVLDVFGYFR